MPLKRRFWLVILTLAAVNVMTSTNVFACLPTNDPAYFSCIAESPWTPLFRTIFGPQTRPRRIAVVIAVSKYRDLTDAPKELIAAGKDSDALANAFKDDLQFDEVIRISDEHFTAETMDRIFKRYLPPLLKAQQNSQLLIAFSGHGNEFEDEGFLLLPTGKQIALHRYEDTLDGWLSMRTFRDLLYDSIKYANQSLLLINSCKSGTFVAQREKYGEDAIASPTAQVITAGGPKDSVAADPTIGSYGGSVFFEMVLAALKNKPLRTASGPIAPPQNDGIVTFWNLFSFLHETSLKLSNRSIAPIPASFMSKTQPPAYDGSFFFIVDDKKAKIALATQYPTQYRSVFGATESARVVPVPSPDYGSLAENAATFSSLPYEIKGTKVVSSAGDWATYERRSGDAFCFMETTGNAALNARLGTRTSLFQDRVKQLKDGKVSKLRLLFDLKSNENFLIYLTSYDFSSEYVNLAINPNFVNAVGSGYAPPIPYSYPGSLLFYQTTHLVENLKSGDYILVEGYTAVYSHEYTERVLGLSPQAKRFVYQTAKKLVSLAQLFPILRGAPEDQANELMEDLKRKINLFDIPFAEPFDEEVVKRAKLEGLSVDDLLALRVLKDDDLTPIIGDLLGRQRRFRDELSLWGFSDSYKAMRASCISPPTTLPTEVVRSGGAGFTQKKRATQSDSKQ